MFNASVTIVETLQSIDNASEGLGVEVIVVDDSSTDNSYNIVSSMSLRNCDLRLYSSPKKGPQEARNFGLSMATNPYIQWFDADDVLNFNRFTRARSLILKFNCDILVGDWVFLDEIPKNLLLANRPKHGVVKCEELFSFYWSGVGMFQTGCWILTREIAELISWNEQIVKNQDGLYFTRALLMAKNIFYDKNIAVHYRRPGKTNISQRDDTSALKSRVIVQRYYSKIATKLANRSLALAVRNGFFSIYIDSINSNVSIDFNIIKHLRRFEFYTSKGFYLGLIGIFTKKHLRHFIS